MSTVSSIWPSSLRSSGVLVCPWVFMACVAAASIKSWRCDCGAIITSWQFFSLGNFPQLATTHVPFFKFSCLRSIPDTSLFGFRCVLVLGEPAEQIAHQRSEEHTSELQSRLHLVCRLLLEKKKSQFSPSSLASSARFYAPRPISRLWRPRLTRTMCNHSPHLVPLSSPDVLPVTSPSRSGCD